MKVKDKVDLTKNHRIEWGDSTKDGSKSIRNRYHSDDNIFNVRGSAELFWRDFITMINESIRHNKFSPQEIAAIQNEIKKKIKTTLSYELILEKDGNIFLRKDYTSLDEINEFLHEESHEHEFSYKIINIADGTEIDSGFVESDEDIESGTLDMMFPDRDEEDEDSDDGFDWTFED